METRWIPKDRPGEEEVHPLMSALKVDRVLAELLLQRGIRTFEEARSFFRPSLDQLHDPFLMKDMDKAVARLEDALRDNEPILVYGDYDVDGTTAVALVHGFLQQLGANSDYYIPDRFTEGYGFSMKGVEQAHLAGVRLIITLDCGIKDGERIRRCNELGMDVIVCDHHNPGVLPPALAVLDPKREDCPYPYKGLSGCGVGFKFLQGFCQRTGVDPSPLLAELDLLTISIGADIVPLTGENRVLAAEGLRLLQDARRPGIAELLRLAGFRNPSLTISDVVFKIAPRINAAGRILSGRRAVELLLAPDEASAAPLGAALEEHNTTRKSLDKDITAEAIDTVEADAFYTSSFSTVVHREGWSKGVIGIVASRLVEKYYKPAIVLSLNEGKLAGSARSIPGVDLYEVLGRCGDLLEQYGGHTMAAGLSLKPENFLPFRERFDCEVAAMLGHERPVPTIEYDAEVTLADLTPKFFRILDQFAPFGPENMAPLFLVRAVRNAGKTRTVGSEHTHLKLQVTDDTIPVAMDGIGFSLGHWASVMEGGESVDLLFTLEKNEWNGRESLQLQVRDIRLSAHGDPNDRAS